MKEGPSMDMSVELGFEICGEGVGCGDGRAVNCGSGALLGTIWRDIMRLGLRLNVSDHG